MARQPSPWRRGGGAWYAQVNRRLVWLAPKDAPKSEAQAALYKRLADQKAARTAQDNPTVAYVFRLYLVHCQAEVTRDERTQDSLDTKLWFLRSAQIAFGRVLAAKITPQHVLAWLDGKPTWKQSSRASATKHVKAAFRWAAEVGHLAANPLAGLKGGRIKVREEIPSEDDVARLLGHLKGPLRDFVFALVETGCRPRELYTLTADRVDLEAGVWTVLNKTRDKTHEQYRTVYLTDALMDLSRRLLEAWPAGVIFRNGAGRAWTRAHLGKEMIRARLRWGLPACVCLYALRHRYVTTALVRGVPIATVAALVGHKSVAVTSRIYSKLNREAEHLRDAARQARGASHPVSPDTPRSDQAATGQGGDASHEPGSNSNPPSRPPRRRGGPPDRPE